MKENIKKIFLWAPPVFYMALIFFISSQPLEIPALKHGVDKGVHLIEYAVLAHLFQFSFRRTTRMSAFRIRVISILLTIIFGISDEFHQLFVPNRSCDVFDALADALGSLTVFLKIF